MKRVLALSVTAVLAMAGPAGAATKPDRPQSKFGIEPCGVLQGDPPPPRCVKSLSDGSKP